MKGTFTETIKASWEWTKTILFRQFNLKKWFFLCIITLLAMEFSGCNFNFNLPLKKTKEETVQAETIKQAVTEPEAKGGIDNNKKIPHPYGQAFCSPCREESLQGFVITFFADRKGIFSSIGKYFYTFLYCKITAALTALLIIAGIIIAFFLLLLLMWIYSRFSFVFLSSIVNNDASIKAPFRENKYIGNSFFKWNISIFCIFCGITVLWGAFLAGGIYLFRNAFTLWKALLIIFPWTLIALAILILFGIVNIIVRDLVLPVMFKNKVGVLSGLREILPIIKEEKFNLIKYILIKAGLRILTAILAGFFTFAIIFALLIPISVVFGLLYLFSSLLSSYLLGAYYALLIFMAIICILWILFLANFALLPIPVYFRTFSLKFLARLDERYDLFRIQLN